MNTDKRMILIQRYVRSIVKYSVPNGEHMGKSIVCVSVSVSADVTARVALQHLNGKLEMIFEPNDPYGQKGYNIEYINTKIKRRVI